jgi:hypothetical protein
MIRASSEPWGFGKLGSMNPDPVGSDFPPILILSLETTHLCRLTIQLAKK